MEWYEVVTIVVVACIVLGLCAKYVLRGVYKLGEKTGEQIGYVDGFKDASDIFVQTFQQTFPYLTKMEPLAAERANSKRPAQSRKVNDIVKPHKENAAKH